MTGTIFPQVWLANRRILIGLAIGLVFIVLATFSFFKGYNGQIQIWGQPFWLIDYHDGFIKRGLAGAITGFFTDRHNLSRLWSHVLAIHFVLCALILIAIGLWGLLRAAKPAVLMIVALFFTSPFLATLAYNTGYLDAPVYLLYVTAVLCLAANWYIAAIVIGCIGPFIHESFAFFWAALIVLAVWRDGFRRGAWLLLPLLGTVVVLGWHSQSAAVAQIMRSPLADPVKAGMIDHQFGQTIAWALGTMYRHYMQHPWNALMSIVWFGLTTVAMIACYVWSSHLDRRTVLALLLATLAPTALIFVAWDLSRFLVASALACVVAILFIQTAAAVETRIKTGACALVIAVGAFNLATPAVYAYFQNAAVFDSSSLKTLRTPWGRTVKAYFEGPYSGR